MPKKPTDSQEYENFEDFQEAVKVITQKLNPDFEACFFIPLSNLIPKHWGPDFWNLICENAPFSWGDNNRSLVSCQDFAHHCSERLSGEDVVQEQELDVFLKKLSKLGNNYIDLEN